jgi:hypothetical protein
MGFDRHEAELAAKNADLWIAPYCSFLPLLQQINAHGSV